MKNKLYVPKRTVANISILILLGLFVVLQWDTMEAPSNWALTSSWCAIALCVYQLRFVLKNKTPYYDFRVWFVFLQYIFIFGRIFLRGFNLDGEMFWNLMEYYDDSAMYKASIYGLLYTQAIFTGLFWNDVKSKTIEKKIEPFSPSCLATMGILVILFSLPFRVSYDLQQIAAQQLSGRYVAVGVESGMIYSFAMLLPVGLIYLLCSDGINKRIIRVIFLVCLTYLGGVMILSGDRRYVITAVIAITLCYLEKEKIKLKPRRLLLLAIVAFFALSLLATIRSTRMHTVSSFVDFFNLYVQTLSTSNIVYETFAEFGLTFFIYAAAVQFFPSIFPYKYGITYLLGPITIIPMSGYVFPGLQKSISAHIDCKSITGHPLGAALGEELYCNFGLGAGIIAIFAGFIINRIMGKGREAKNHYETAKYYSLFYIMLNLVRSSSTEIMRLVAYSIAIPYLFGLIYKGNVKDKV